MSKNTTDIYTVRNARPGEFSDIGKLMVQVYSQLDGFPKESEQPNYYKMLANVGDLTNKPETELLVAASTDGKLVGAVVFFGDMKYMVQEEQPHRKRMRVASDYLRLIQQPVGRGSASCLPVNAS